LNFGTIADNLGITRANIHYHFKNKEKLALSTIERYMTEGRQVMGAISERFPADFPGMIGAIEEELWKEYEAAGTMPCVCAALMRGGEGVPKSLMEESARHYQDIVGVFTHHIKASQGAGTVKSKRKAEDIAREGLLLFFALMQLRSTSKEGLNTLEFRGSLSKWAKSL